MAAADPAIGPRVVIDVQLETKPVLVERDRAIEVGDFEHDGDEAVRHGGLPSVRTRDERSDDIERAACERLVASNRDQCRVLAGPHAAGEHVDGPFG